MIINNLTYTALLLIQFLIFEIPSNFTQQHKGRTFYISPNGSDKNPGTLYAPRKSFSYAVRSLRAGDTLLVQNGIYHEKKMTLFLNSGTKEKNIVVAAVENQQAKIIYDSVLKLRPKIYINKKNYITIKGLNITQQKSSAEKANKTTDVFVRSTNARGNSFINNLISNGSVGIKSDGSSNTIIKNNTIENMDRTSIDVLNDENTLVENNIIRESGYVGIMIKGGSRSITVINNSIYNYRKQLKNSAITIGGETNKTSTYDYSINGFEAYNVIVVNNKIVTKLPGGINNGISYMGSKDSKSYNNIIIGANNGFNFFKIGGIKNGWEWDPINVNPIIKNNIIIDIKNAALHFYHTPINLTSDYNLYFNNKISPNEPNSVYSAPLFYLKYSDHRLKPSSPAIGKGAEIPSEVNMKLNSRNNWNNTSSVNNIGNID